MKNYFAVVAPGLEKFAANELKALGMEPKIETGGVAFETGPDGLCAVNLNLRIGSRVLERMGEFRAVAFYELVKKAARLEWEQHLLPGQPVAVHVTCHKSRLYHSDAVADRVAAAIGQRLGQPAPLVKASEDPTDPPQLVVVRFLHDICTISADTSGELLHRRGYRLAAAKAPLRETLAAGMLAASGWDGAAPLVDPFCGSGTIGIEAALLARGIPPGGQRRFAFMNWPGYDRRRWERALAAARKGGNPAAAPLILASDRDDGAVEMARQNAGRAGMAGVVNIERRAISDLSLPPGPGWVVTNPPYGVRVSENKDLRNLYARLGDVLREQAAGWRYAILVSDMTLFHQTRLKMDESIPMVNGGLPVHLAVGQV